MHLPIEELTPRQIVAELDRYIIGQAGAKRAVAVALRNRYRRQLLPLAERDDILPKNILMIGPTGVGKTEIARRLAQLARAPFVKVEATKFTEVGYVGRDVESMIRELVASAVRLVEREKFEAVRAEALRRAEERLLDLLEVEFTNREIRKKAAKEANPIVRQAMETFGFSLDEETPETPEKTDSRSRRRRRLLRELQGGKLEDREVEIETEETQNPFVQVFTPQGMEEMGLDTNQVGSPFPPRLSSRRVTVAEARGLLADEEAKRLVDRGAIHREAVLRAEQTGIIFLDELDKVAGKTGGAGPDVSREGVQRDLLPVIEGSTVATKFGPVRTDHILFIAAGAFHMAKPSDLIPELQGRLPIRVELESLTEDDFARILHEPHNALTKQYSRLLEMDGVSVTFEESALSEIARLASEVNAKTENIGARRLHTMMERLLETLAYEAPETETKEVCFTGEMVRECLGDLVKDADLSRYIL